MLRGGSRTAATSKIELFVVIVNSLKSVIYYHKELHFGCCSSTRSASGTHLTWRARRFKDVNSVQINLKVTDDAIIISSFLQTRDVYSVLKRSNVKYTWFAFSDFGQVLRLSIRQYNIHLCLAARLTTDDD